MTCRRIFLLKAAAVAWTAWAVSLTAGASSTFPFIPDHYTFTRAQLQAYVATRFPVRGTLGAMIDVTLNHPVLTLRVADNRLVLNARARLASPFMPQALAGVLSVAGRLAYDAPTRSIVVHDLRVEKADFGAAGAPYAQQIDAAADFVVSQLLENAAVYTFKPEELSFAGVQFAPGAMTVTPAGLRVEIVELSPNAQNAVRHSR